MSEYTVVVCPRCAQKYRVTPDKLGGRATCKKCGQGFKIAEDPPIDDDTICGWVTEDDPASQSVLGGTGIVQAPPARPKEASTGVHWTHRPPPSLPRVAMESIDASGVQFVFPVNGLHDADLRASFPHRCVNCLSRTNLRVHLMLWATKLPRHDAVHLREMEKRTLRRLDQLMFRYKLDWFSRLESLDAFPPPFNLPMPYYSCDHCSIVGEVASRTLSRGDEEFCQIGVANLTIGLDFYRNNGGRGTPGYQRLLLAGRQQRDNEWGRLPHAVRTRLTHWYTPVDGERFLGFFADHDFTPSERGASGLVLTDKRMIYKKYAANRVFVLDKGGKINIEGSKSSAMIEISQPGEREALLRSHPTAAGSLARSLTELHYPWQVIVKTVGG